MLRSCAARPRRPSLRGVALRSTTTTTPPCRPSLPSIRPPSRAYSIVRSSSRAPHNHHLYHQAAISKVVKVSSSHPVALTSTRSISLQRTLNNRDATNNHQPNQPRFLSLSLDEQTAIIFLLLALLVCVSETVIAEQVAAPPGTPKPTTAPLPTTKLNTQPSNNNNTKKKKPITKKQKALASILFKNQVAVEAVNCGLLDAYFVNSVRANQVNEDDHAEVILPDQAVFAVFDGHTGRGAVDFLKAKFLKDYVLPAVQNAKDIADVVHALKEAFVRADIDFLGGALRDNDINRGLSGACVVVAYIRRNLGGRNVLFVANAGDCRAVLLSREPLEEDVPFAAEIDTQLVATALSRDHQASVETEAERIMEEHPHEPDAVMNGRVKGFLEPSRGIGDGRYKIAEFNDRAARPRPNWHPPYTTAEPEVSFHELHEEDAYVVLATDGLWGQQTNDNVASLIEGYERAMRLRLSKDWISDIKKDDKNLYKEILRLSRITNLATAIITENLRLAALEFPISVEYDADGKKRQPRAALTRMILLPAKARRRLYDDTTVTVVRLKSVPATGGPLVRVDEEDELPEEMMEDDDDDDDRNYDDD